MIFDKTNIQCDGNQIKVIVSPSGGYEGINRNIVEFKNEIEDQIQSLQDTTARFAFDTLQEAQDEWASFSQEEKDELDGKTFVVKDENAEYKWDSTFSGGTDFIRHLGVQKGEITPEKTTFFEISKNLFNPNDPEYVEGYFLSVDGSGILMGDGTSGYNTTGFIRLTDVGVGDKIYFSKGSGGRRSRQVDFYDTNKNVIPELHLNQTTDVGVVEIPEGASYFRVSFESDITDYQIEVGEIPTSYEPFQWILEKGFIPEPDNITPEKTNFFELNRNLFNPNDPNYAPGYFLPSTGELVANSSYNTTGYIAIPEHSAEDKIYFSKSSGFRRSRYVAFYDAALNFLPDLHLNNTSDVASIEIPPEASYFRVTFESDITDYQIEVGQNETEYTPYGYVIKDVYIEKSKKPTNDKSVLIFGDSITAGNNSWVKFLPKLTSVGAIWNRAVSGASWQDDPGNTIIETGDDGVDYNVQDSKGQIGKALVDNDISNPDIIITTIGTNDKLERLGDYSTAMSKNIADLDTSLTYEAMRWGMYTLRNNYPDATFYACTPIQLAYNETEELAALDESIIKMAKRYNFILIDLRSESGIVKDFEVEGGNGRYLHDGLHPYNTEPFAADKLIAKRIASKILNTYIDF